MGAETAVTLSLGSLQQGSIKQVLSKCGVGVQLQDLCIPKGARSFPGGPCGSLGPHTLMLVGEDSSAAPWTAPGAASC